MVLTCDLLLVVQKDCVSTGSGNMGLGTASPSSLGTNITTLEIQGAATTRSGGIRLSTSNNSQKAAFYVYDGAGIVGTETAHPFGIYTSNTERMRIDSSGNMGWAPRRLTPICTLRVVILPFILNEIVP